MALFAHVNFSLILSFQLIWFMTLMSLISIMVPTTATKWMTLLQWLITPNYLYIDIEGERAHLILIAIRKGLYQSVSRLKLLTVLLSVFSCGIWHLEVGKVVAAMALLQKLKPHIHQHRLQISMKPGQSRTRDWLMSSFKKSCSRLFFFQKLNQKSRYWF